MAKSSGATRGGGSNNPRGLNTNRSFSGWSLREDRYGNPEIYSKGRNAEMIYNALSSSVEQAVESKVGSIRSGGGYSGPENDREYAIIFRDNATYTQIDNYMKGMSEGAKLYNNWRNASGQARAEAEEEYNKWFNKTYRR